METSARFQRLATVWPWLVHFRAIAETEHLPTAAETCGVGPSSLSRSLSLLERHLGRQLFERAGRNLRRNAYGDELLAAVREAMRGIDDAVEHARGEGLRGPMTIASAGAGTTALVGPAIRKLRSDHPAIEPHLVTHSQDEVTQALLRGRFDIAFQELAVRHPGLTTRRVCELTRAVYCGPRHELHGVARPKLERVLAAEFVAPRVAAAGPPVDGWPPEHQRHVAMTTDQLRVGLELCVEQPLLAVLPDVLAKLHPELWRLEAPPIQPSSVFAIYRQVLGSRPSAAATLAGLVGAD